MTKELAKKAADWWCGQVEGHTKFDNGDQSQQGGVAMIMATMLASHEKQKLSDDSVKIFHEKIMEYVQEKLTENPEYTVRLSSDYSPDHELSQLCSAASIPGTLMPWKTRMWISMKDGVRVSCGYGAETQTL